MFYSVCLHSTRQLLNYSERAERLRKDDKDDGKLLAAFLSECETRRLLKEEQVFVGHPVGCVVKKHTL